MKKDIYNQSENTNYLFYKYQTKNSNGAEGSIPHLKTIIVEEEDNKTDDCTLFVGSHNMTKAAWGGYEKLGSSIHKIDKAQLNCSNS